MFFRKSFRLSSSSSPPRRIPACASQKPRAATIVPVIPELKLSINFDALMLPLASCPALYVSVFKRPTGLYSIPRFRTFIGVPVNGRIPSRSQPIPGTFLILFSACATTEASRYVAFCASSIAYCRASLRSVRPSGVLCNVDISALRAARNPAKALA